MATVTAVQEQATSPLRNGSSVASPLDRTVEMAAVKTTGETAEQSTAPAVDHPADQGVEATVEMPAVVAAEAPTAIVAPPAEAVGRPASNGVASNGVAVHAPEQAAEPSAQDDAPPAVADEVVEAPAEEAAAHISPSEPVADAAAEEVAETDAGTLAAEPTDHTTAERTDHTTAEPTDHTAADPADHTAAEPTDQTAADSTDHTAAEPTDRTAAEPAGDTAAEPAGDTAAEPTGDTAAEPTGDTAVEPAAERDTEATVVMAAVVAGEAAPPTLHAADPTVELPVVRPALDPRERPVPTPARAVPVAVAEPDREDASVRAGLLGRRLMFGIVAALVVLAHLGAALVLAVNRVATQGEAGMAVAALAARGTSVSPGPLALWDRFGALQIAVVELLLPAADPVDVARWACLAIGAVTTLLVWPVLRNGLGLSVTATAVAVAVLGIALPLLSLRAGIIAAAPAALWLTVAVLLEVGDRHRSALIAALVAVVSAPLAAAALLGCAAYLIFTRSVRAPAPRVSGVVVGLAALTVAVLASGPGPLAGTGPDMPSGFAIAGAVVGLVLVVLAARWARWLRPVLAGAVVLIAATVVPGPSGVAAALLVAPMLAAAVAVIVERVLLHRALRVVALAAVLLLLAGPSVAAALSDRTPAVEGSLAGWAATQTGATTVVAADPLDRAALLAAGFPAARLHDLADPPVPGELRLVSIRPGGTATPCPPALVLASTPRGAGGAPGAVCATGTVVADDVTARVRFGSALATNRALDLGPAAAGVLRDGEADPRLLLTLAALTGAHRIGIADLPAVPLDAPGVPRHQALLTSFDGGPAAQSELLRTWLGAQQPPFMPTVTPIGSALLLTYPVPAPTGLLPS